MKLVTNSLILSKYGSHFPFLACGGELTGEGVIRSPFHPNAYPGQRTCRWTISQPQRQIVLLNFTDFQIGSSASCDTDYLEVRLKYPLSSTKVPVCCVYEKDCCLDRPILRNRIQHVYGYIR